MGHRSLVPPNDWGEGESNINFHTKELFRARRILALSQFPIPQGGGGGVDGDGGGGGGLVVVLGDGVS